LDINQRKNLFAQKFVCSPKKNLTETMKRQESQKCADESVNKKKKTKLEEELKKTEERVVALRAAAMQEKYEAIVTSARDSLSTASECMALYEKRFLAWMKGLKQIDAEATKKIPILQKPFPSKETIISMFNNPDENYAFRPLALVPFYREEDSEACIIMLWARDYDVATLRFVTYSRKNTSTALSPNHESNLKFLFEEEDNLLVKHYNLDSTSLMDGVDDTDKISSNTGDVKKKESEQTGEQRLLEFFWGTTPHRKTENDGHCLRSLSAFLRFFIQGYYLSLYASISCEDSNLEDEICASNIKKILRKSIYPALNNFDLHLAMKMYENK
jgi:hypothetical protein